MFNKKYTVRELIHNQSFRRMVKGTATADDISCWNDWIEASDRNREKAKKAITEIAGFKFKDTSFVNVKGEWDRLQKTITKKNSTKLPYATKKNWSWRWFYRFAAILILGAFIGIGLYEHSINDSPAPKVEKITRRKTVKTESGEQKTVKFSNGSRVILNSSSQMTYDVDLIHDQTINILLEGEAYFESAKDGAKNNPVFVVHTPDGIIRDIGTRFMVTVRRNSSRVILQDGEVNVHTIDADNKTQDISMKKGEMLSFNKKSIIDKKMVNATYYTSWATGFMHFDHTTIQQFAGYVEKKFDVNVSIMDPKLNHITIDGSIYFRSIAGLVRSVTEVAKIPAYQSRDKKTIYIGDIKGFVNNSN